jgi:TolB-like protein/cytochrome c-type biogenesis protein CcmH/NrfG
MKAFIEEMPMTGESSSPPGPFLANDEFVTALRGALRDYNRPDLLTRNRLLQARLLARAERPGPAELRTLLSETVGTLFVSARDEKIRRALELTYFETAPKQEVVADRLGLAFGTYRRHLTAGHKRLADWLWQKETAARAAEPVAVPAPAASIAKETAASPARRLSIVILPFQNLSGNAADDYLVDGVVNNLISSLSRALPGSFVISRSTAFTYKGRAASSRQVGEELGVRYVLEGGISVTASADRVSINAQLVDAETDETLWVERFETRREALLETQEEIVARLSRSVGQQMIRSEALRAGSSGDSVDLVMRGQALANDIRRAERASDAVVLFERALELDPHNVDALVGIASTRVFQVLNQYVADGRNELLDEAEAMIARAMPLAPDHLGLLRARAALLRARGRFGEAVVTAATMIARNPGEPTAYRELGLDKLYLGETAAAEDWFRRADRVAPRDPHRWTWLQGLGRALMQSGRDAEAVEVLRETLASNPAFIRARALLAAAEALAGDLDNARRSMAAFLAAEPAMTVRQFVEERSPVPLEAVDARYLEESRRIADGLSLAGMPPGEQDQPRAAAADPVPVAAAGPTARAAPPLSIVVLPFVNLGGADDDYLADGITESLTTDISRIPDAFVIARATAFSYKGKDIDLRQLGRELGVRYVLEGSVQGSAQRVRFNAQLLDAESGAHIWAERFDKPRTDLFDMQDEVTSRLARMVDVELVAAESRRARGEPEDDDAIDLAMRGRAVLNADVSVAAARMARRFFEEALRRDGRNVAALVGLAEAHTWEVNMYLSDDRAEQTRLAEAAALQALSLAPSSANVRCCLGTVLWATGLPDRALREFELAIAIDRNLAIAHAYSGQMKFYLGRFAETEPHVAEALRLSPRDPLLFHWRYFVGSADLCLGRTVRAITALRHSVELNAQWPFSHFVLASALALGGLLAEAADRVAAGLRLAPQFTIARLRAQSVGANPIYLGQRERLYEGLRRAGLPEE